MVSFAFVDLIHWIDPHLRKNCQTDVRTRKMKSVFEHLPRRIFLDSCTAQTLLNYGSYISEGESISPNDRAHSVPDLIENIEALRSIFLVSERALFEWIISQGSIREGEEKHDAIHMRWLNDIASHTECCLEGEGPTDFSRTTAQRLSEPKFGYLSKKDALLLKHALLLRCEAFLTVERKLPRNAAHLERELGLRILTPAQHWELLRPWAALWR